jgi:hypothetical protein
LSSKYVIESIVEEKVQGYETQISAPDGALIDDAGRTVQLTDSQLIDKDIEISYVNKYIEPAQEGIQTDYIPYVISIVIGMGITVLFLFRRRKHR